MESLCLRSDRLPPVTESRSWSGSSGCDTAQPVRSPAVSAYVDLAYAHFAVGRFEDAARRSCAGESVQPEVHHAPCPASGPPWPTSERVGEATAVLAHLREIAPGLTVATAIRSARYVDPAKNAELGEALRRAGLPD